MRTRPAQPQPGSAPFRRRAERAAALILFLAVSCTDQSTQPSVLEAPAAAQYSTAKPWDLTIAPKSASLVTGDSVQLVATVIDRWDRPIDPSRVMWMSANPAIATVSSTGKVKGLQAGSAKILAGISSLRDTAQITVATATPVAITTTALPGATVGTAYGQTLTATGGNGSYAWSLSAGALPTGLTLNASTGAIAGTPSASGTSSFTVQATSAGLSDTQALSITVAGSPGPVAECATPRAAWIWCDDFDVDRLSSYFERSSAGGAFARVSGVGRGGSFGMRATYQPGIPDAGNLKLAFGATPTAYFRPVDAGVAKNRDVYWRVYVRTQTGWNGQGPGKLSRAMVLATSSWAQAAIGHVWTPGTAPYLQIDPVRGTDASGVLRTTTYNDFANFTWLGALSGTTPLFSAGNANVWFCVEAHMRLNDPGVSNGIEELWVDGRLEARRADLNWLGSYSNYGINAIFFENYWNAPGSPVAQSRFLDNIVVSTERIGC